MYRDVVEPVARHFATERGIVGVTLHDDGQFQPTSVKVTGANVQSIWHHWNKEVGADERNLRRGLATALADLTALKQLPSLLTDGHDLPWEHVQSMFSWLWKVYLPSLVPHLALSRHILAAHRPAIVISPDGADPRNRLFYLAARTQGIPSLEIQFGMHDEGSVEWRFFASDRVAVWGPRARQVLAAQGVPEERIDVTGSPRFDAVATATQETSSRVRARLGIPDGGVMVLFASQPSFGQGQLSSPQSDRVATVKRAVFLAAERVDGVCLVVKPHPIESGVELRAMAAGCQRIAFADPSDDIRELIMACDVFVTLGSTATMDALLANKMIVFPAFPGLVWWDDMYLKSRVTVVADSDETVEQVFRAAVSGQRTALLAPLAAARGRFLAEWVSDTDGHATARVAAVADRMMRGRT